MVSSLEKLDNPLSLSGEQRTKFWSLWTATATGNLADGLFKLALPVFATRLTSSPLLVAGVTFTMTLPWLLFGLLAGALVDRLDRRKTLLCVNTLRVLVLALLALATPVRSVFLPAIYLTALVLGIAETLADTAASSLLPDLVPPSRLEWANAHLIRAQTVMNEFIGPPLGGALAALGLAVALGTSGWLYLLALLALLLLRGSFRPVRSSRTSLKMDIVEGVRFLWRNPLLRTLAGIVAVMNLCWSAWSSVLVLYVVAPGPVGLTTFGYGLLLTGIGVGGLLGTFLVIPAQRWPGRRWTIAADILGTMTMLLIPALTTNPWAIGAAAVIGGIGSTMWGVTVRALQQRLVPNELFGRVGGATRVLGFGALSLGAALAGLVAQFAGVRTVFLGGALLTTCLLIPFFRVVTSSALAASECPS